MSLGNKGPTTSPRHRNGTPYCRFFLQGFCSRGERCKFLHEIPNPEATFEDPSLIDTPSQQFNGWPRRPAAEEGTLFVTRSILTCARREAIPLFRPVTRANISSLPRPIRVPLLAKKA